MHRRSRCKKVNDEISVEHIMEINYLGITISSYLGIETEEKTEYRKPKSTRMPKNTIWRKQTFQEWKLGEVFAKLLKGQL